MARLKDNADFIWQVQVPGASPTAPSVANGRLVYGDTETVVKNGQRLPAAVIHCLEIQRGAEIWTFSMPAYGVLYTPPVLGANAVYAAGNSIPGYGSPNVKLYSLDPATGTTNWVWSEFGEMNAPPVPVAGLVLVGLSNGKCFALGQKDGKQVWAVSLGSNSVAVLPGAVVGTMAVIAVNSADSGTLLGVDGSSSKILWTYNLNSRATTGPTVGNGLAYVGCDDGSVHAVNLQTGALAWRAVTDGSVDGAPAFAAGVVYAGSADQGFYAFDGNTGTQVWKLDAGSPIDSPITARDGIAYFGVQASKFFAVDLASNGEEVLQYDTGGSPSYAGAVADGVVFYAEAKSITAVRASEVLNAFFSSSELMVEEYATPPDGTYAPSTTSYRTDILLVDDNRNPRSGQPVKITAAEAVTIACNGQSYNIDANTPALVNATVAGELAITSYATTIGAPALSFWASFMGQDEAIVVYPDHVALQKMGNVQGGQLLSATDYNSQPIVQSQYLSPDNCDQIAASVRNAMGVQPSHEAARSRNAAASPKWIAWPESTPNMVYQSQAGPAGRTWSPGEFANWKVDVGDTTVVFGEVSPEDAARMLESLPALDWKGFKEFFENVVKGFEKVTQIVWTALEKGAQVLFHTVENAYKFVIETIEDAINAVIGFFKTVVTDIEKAVQWLSYVFSWEKILAARNTIVEGVTAAYNAATTWFQSGYQTPVTQIFDKMESGVASAFQKVIDDIGGKTMVEARGSNQDPQTIYGAGGAQSYSQTKWLQSKFSANAGGATLAPAALAPGVADPVADFLQFLETAAQTLGDELATLWTDVKEVFDAFELLFKNPEGFIRNELSAVLTLFEDLVEGLIAAAGKIVLAFLECLGDIFAEFWAVINATIDIPVLSALYKAIAKDDLSLLNFVCWLAAIPTSIIAEALNIPVPTAPGWPQPDNSAQEFWKVSYTVALGVYILFDVINDLEESSKIITGMYLANSGLIQLLSAPYRSPGNAEDWLIWALASFGIVTSTADIKAMGGGLPAWLAWEEISPFVTFGYGMFMVAIYCIFAVEYGGGFAGWGLVQNFFTTIPLMGKPLKEAGPLGKDLLFLADAIGDCANLFISAIDWQPPDLAAAV